MRIERHTLQLAQEVHGELARRIAPATPESIRASNWRNNRALLTILVLTGVSVLMFVMPPLWREFAALVLQARFPPDGTESQKLSQLLGAAGLGAGFYALSTAARYMRDRTFDPSYNQVYLLRFVLGILAGFIAGTFAEGLFEAPALQYGRPTLALLGGFASEAVVQALKRVSDTLLTMVRGSDKDRLKAEQEAESAKQSAEIAMELNEAIGDPAPLDKVREVSKRLVSVRP